MLVLILLLSHWKLKVRCIALLDPVFYTVSSVIYCIFWQMVCWSGHYQPQISLTCVFLKYTVVIKLCK